MQSELKTRMKRQRGTTLVLLAVFIVALFAFAALSIDVANVLHHQRNTQAATDAGAFAAAELLAISPPVSDTAIIQEAQNITVANKVTLNEITASSAGTIQVGNWNGTAFTPNATPRNAVRVPATREVPLLFGNVVGMGAMSPATYSIGGRTPLGCMTNVLPFGVSIQEIAGKDVGDTMLLNDDAITSGNQGKININNYRNVHAWAADMVALGCGAACQVCAEEYPVITGNAHVAQTFRAIEGASFVIPIVDQSGFRGMGVARVIGYVHVRLDWSDGTGSNWKAQVTFLELSTTGPGGGTCFEPVCLTTRALLQ